MAIQENRFVKINYKDASGNSTYSIPNTILYITTQTPINAPSNVENYIQTYSSFSQTERDFALNSDASNILRDIFGQDKNPTTADGVVHVLYNKTIQSASSGQTVCTFPTGALSSFQATNNGALTFEFSTSANSEQITLRGLDFLDAKSLDDVASIIQDRIYDYSTKLPITVNLSPDKTKIIFETFANYGANSTIQITPTPNINNDTDLYGATFLDGAQQVSAGGVDGSASDFYAILNKVLNTDATIDAAVLITDIKFDNISFGNMKTAVYQLNDVTIEGCHPLTWIVSSTSLYEAQWLVDRINAQDSRVGTNVPDLPVIKVVSAPFYESVGVFAGWACGVDYTNRDTMYSPNFKNPYLLSQGSQYYDSADLDKAKTLGVDIIGSMASGGTKTPTIFTNPSTVKAYRIHHVVGVNAVLITCTKSLYNLLAQDLPMNADGIHNLYDVLISNLKQFRLCGLIDPNPWEGEIPVGFDVNTFKQNILSNGFAIKVALPTSENARKQAVLNSVQVAIKLVGYVEYIFVTITGQL